MHFSTLVGLLTVSTALAETLKVGDSAQGAEFTKCIKVTDFNTKSLSDDVEVTDKVDGCCPEGYIPGIKHYNNYWGAMVICGFKDDGSIEMKSSSSNDVKTCTYNKCYVVKMSITCKDNSKMTLDGCCPKDQYTDTCKHYVKSQSFFNEKVGYCLSYQKKYKLEGTSEKTDDQVIVDGVTSLSLTNLKAYTVCPGGWGSGNSAYELVGDAACHNDANSPGTGDLKFVKSKDKGDACAAACTADATCTGYDDRAAGCVYYKIKIAKSNAASTAYKCYRKVMAAASPAAAAPAPASPAPAEAAPAPAGGSGKGLSCNVGTKTSYSGCSGMSDADTFAETDCSASGGTKCLTLQYSADGGGCSVSSAVGYCVTSSTTCEFYVKTYKGQDAYKDYACSECEEDNCNTKDTKSGGSSSPTATSNAHGAVTSIAMLGAICIFTWA